MNNFKEGDMVRLKAGKYVSVLMTVERVFKSTQRVACVWFEGVVCKRHTFKAACLVKEQEMISFTVEVHLPSKYSWKRCVIRTHIVTAQTAHQARRDILQMYLGQGKRVLSTQVVDRYPTKGV